MAGEYKIRGHYMEDFIIGEEYVSSGRTITEADVMSFAGLSGDYNPIHVDEEAAKKGMYGTRIAHGALGFIISTGLSNQMGLYEGTAIAFVECTLKYVAPLMIGDTIRVVIVPTEMRHTSKPGRGILKQNLKLLNQNDKVIMESDQVIMMKTRT